MNRNYNRGVSAFQRPENALKRAEELQKVGQKTAAVLALHDVLTSRRHRTWAKGLEEIVFRFIDLCVEERKGRYAKEALMQYRNTCQNVNINSLEEVIKYLLKKATERAEDAQAKADAATLDVDDLDDDQSPEDLMLSYVSDKSGKDRTDREMVTPWFRFLWETYRNVLDILRNNVKFTQMYGMVTKQAFQFCLQYKRTTEFRRLCEILRNQLQMLKKNERSRDQRDRPDLSNPETLNQCLETRFEQLNVACALEMWQEAFRSIEDIHGLWALNKKMPKPGLRAQYFSCLTDIFSKSGSHVYHAYSWYQLFMLSAKLNKGLTVEDKASMGSAVLLATLAIDPYDRKGPETENARTKADRASRIVDILGFNHDPTRSPEDMLSRTNLLSELSARGITQHVPKNVAAIFRILEHERDPLNLCHNVAPHLAALENQTLSLSPAAPVATINHGQHVAPLRAVAVLKMMRQLGSVYSVMRMDKLAALVPFMSFSEVEAVLADAIKYGYVQVQIDHRTGTLYFGAPQLRSDAMSLHLSTVATRLSAVMGMINPTAAVSAALEARSVTAREALASAGDENKNALARKVLIERRKEENERALLEAEHKEEQKRRAEAQALEEAETKRRREEAVRREEERINREYAEAEAEEVRKIMAEKGIKVTAGETLDKKALLQKQYDIKMKEQNEFESKMAKMAKVMDHLERARRLEEVPYLMETMRVRREEDKAYYEAQQVEAAETHKRQWVADLEAKQRTAKMEGDREAFKSQVTERRAEEIGRLRRDADRRRKDLAAQVKSERLAARKVKYLERSREHVLSLMKELELKAVEQAEADRKRERDERLAKAAADKEAEAQAAEARRAAKIAELDAREASGKFVPRHQRAAANAGLDITEEPTSAAPASREPAASGGGFGSAREPYRPRAAAPAGGGGGGSFGARRDAGGGGGAYAPPARDGPRGGASMPSAFGGPRREMGGDREGGGDRFAAGGDRGSGGGGAFGGPRRDEGPRGGGGGMPGAFGGPRREAGGEGGAPPAAGGGGGGAVKGGYIPPHLRNRQ